MRGSQSTDLRRTVYGLTVDCDIPLPELREAGEGGAPADLVIRRGEVPETWEITDELNTRAFADGTPGEMWLRFPETVRLLVRGGKSITYDPHPNAGEDEIRLFLLGSGLGAVMMQRGYIVIHGNAITRPDGQGAIVCIGDSGAGKSTTAVAMMQRGFSILADDVCPMDQSGMLLPGMPRAKLWDETTRQLGIDTGSLDRVRAADAKYNLPLGDGYCDVPKHVSAFVWLVPGDVDAVEQSEISGVEKFTVLSNNIFRPEYLRPLGLEAEYLRAVAKFAATTPVIKIVRPRAGFDLDPLLDRISALHESNKTHPIDEQRPR